MHVVHTVDSLVALGRIDARYHTTAERSIVGESLAGLFIVETALIEPALFDHAVAFDPSLWWNDGALVNRAGALLVGVRRDRGSRAGWAAGRRSLDVAASRDDIGNQTARLDSVMRVTTPPALSWTYLSRPHATIFRALALEGEHPAFGRVTLRQLLSTWVGHDLGHIAQVARVMAKRYRDEVGPWRAYLPVMDR